MKLRNLQSVIASRSVKTIGNDSWEQALIKLCVKIFIAIATVIVTGLLSFQDLSGGLNFSENRIPVLMANCFISFISAMGALVTPLPSCSTGVIFKEEDESLLKRFDLWFFLFDIICGVLILLFFCFAVFYRKLVIPIGAILSALIPLLKMLPTVPEVFSYLYQSRYLIKNGQFLHNQYLQNYYLNTVASLNISRVSASTDEIEEMKNDSIAVKGAHFSIEFNMPEDSKRSKSFYVDLWRKIIFPEILAWVEECPNLKMNKHCFRSIWNAYRSFNLHCSENYMEEPDLPLDRHKVAACYCYAILTASPLLYVGDNRFCGVSERQRNAKLANELLAIAVGSSVLSAFLKAQMESSLSRSLILSDAEIRRIRNAGNNGCLVPAVAHGGSYLNCLRSSLEFTQVEGNYNLLCLSMLFYHLERGWLGTDLANKVAKIHADFSQVEKQID